MTIGVEISCPNKVRRFRHSESARGGEERCIGEFASGLRLLRFRAVRIDGSDVASTQNQYAAASDSVPTDQIRYPILVKIACGQSQGPRKILLQCLCERRRSCVSSHICTPIKLDPRAALFHLQ